MKRLVIHIGTHKTATTTFQRICFTFKEFLLQKDIYYPTLEDYPRLRNHAPVAWNLDQINKSEGQKYLEKILSSSHDKEHSTTLLSSEDFENMLVNHKILEQIIQTASKLRFDSIEILTVIRNPKDYLNSIYNELSKHGAIIDYPTIIRRVEKTGYFAYSGGNFNYLFAINTLPLMNELRDKFPNITFHHYSFEEFTNSYPGKSFIYNLLSREVSQKLETLDLKRHGAFLGNESLSEIETETLYAMNSLGIKDPEKIDNNLKNIIKQITNIRLSRARQGRAIADSIFG